MGKPRKLRASIKALHDALISFRPAVGAPMCIQPAKTHSFRDLLTSFNSVYYVPHTSSASFSDPCSLQDLLYYPQSLPSAEINPLYKGEGEEEEVMSLSATTTTTSTSSSCLSSSSLCVAAAAPDDVKKDEGKAEAKAFPTGVLRSERFFFSPCSSKSIMDDCLLEMGPRQTEPSRDDLVFKPPEAEEYEEEDDVFDMVLEREIETVIEEVATTTGISAPCRDSIPIAMASMDPYMDFRSSMEEMVAAHCLRDWLGLQELLHCYLRLNEKQTHEYIVVAFTDLLMELASEGKVHSSAVHGAFSTPAYAWPPHPTSRLHHRPAEY